MIAYKFKIISSLTKVFPGAEPEDDLKGIKLSCFLGETISLQCAYRAKSLYTGYGRLEVKGSLRNAVRIREVKLMPSLLPCNGECDEHYLSKEPGLYPDLLRDISFEKIPFYPGQWQALWIDLEAEAGMEGSKDLTLQFYDEGNLLAGEVHTEIGIYPIHLKPQTCFHTEWFHCDCLADYYQAEPWSDRHWEIMRNFIALYVKRGMNMILTPAFTPPLDTAEGGERTTVQLVDVKVEGRNYRFSFEKLYTFFGMCMECGVKYFEIAHLFTQWGAKSAPKVMAEKNGELVRIFGWETDSQGLEYQEFLGQFLDALVLQLDEWDLRGRVFFHLSDEPEERDLERYRKARESIASHLNGYPIMDAVSRYAFYESKVVDKPVPAVDHLEPFLVQQVPGLWTYYCGAQGKDVTNRFFAMPCGRTRILGLQMYQYRLEGFLHWGFNFYNSQYSLSHINPYQVTDAGAAFPSGDAFLVYPGEDGCPEESIRLMVLSQAMQDIRAFNMLEELTSREYVMDLITGITEEPITMVSYPYSSQFFEKLREIVNKEIADRKNSNGND